jgi:hypothetical protein
MLSEVQMIILLKKSFIPGLPRTALNNLLAKGPKGLTEARNHKSQYAIGAWWLSHLGIKL